MGAQRQTGVYTLLSSRFQMICKWFSIRLTTNCFSLNLKQDFTVCVLLVAYFQCLRVWLPNIVYMLEVIEESQKKHKKH